jgi:hypothetical protein
MANKAGRKRDLAGFIAAVAAGATVRDAARVAGISEHTAYRKCTEPAFQREVEKLRCDMVARALGKMQDTLTLAADTLRELLDRAQPPTARLGAARALVDSAARLQENVILANEVRELKQEMEKIRNANHATPSTERGTQSTSAVSPTAGNPD